MPKRDVVGDYRYKYQGQEKDPETGMDAFELRLWDARIGRWSNPDPAREFNSPYLGMGNNPRYVDKRGDTISWTGTFLLSKSHMKAYDVFAKTPYGKAFLADYAIGGKYEHINLRYSVHSVKTGVDGHKKDIADGRTYPTIIHNGFKYSRGFKKNENFGELGKNIAINRESFGFNVAFDISTDGSGLDKVSILDLVDDYTHEAIHVDFFMNSLLNMIDIPSTSLQHSIMNDPNSTQFNTMENVRIKSPRYF